MKIAGLEKNSLLDYPGIIAAVVFTPGCNLDCYYCHNRILLEEEKLSSLLRTEEVLAFLEKRKKMLDGVVISGGEPTLQSELPGFIREVRRLGYRIKLDTNGTNPVLLQQLLAEGLLDYVAMDIKAPFAKYEQICGTGAYLDRIGQSIDILLDCSVDYEFRTTMAPDLTAADIVEIAETIHGARLYVLQQYRLPSERLKDDDRLKHRPHEPEYILAIARSVNEMVKKCLIRGIGLKINISNI